MTAEPLPAVIYLVQTASSETLRREQGATVAKYVNTEGDWSGSQTRNKQRVVNEGPADSDEEEGARCRTTRRAYLTGL